MWHSRTEHSVFESAYSCAEILCIIMGRSVQEVHCRKSQCSWSVDKQWFLRVAFLTKKKQKLIRIILENVPLKAEKNKSTKHTKLKYAHVTISIFKIQIALENVPGPQSRYGEAAVNAWAIAGLGEVWVVPANSLWAGAVWARPGLPVPSLWGAGQGHGQARLRVVRA